MTRAERVYRALTRQALDRVPKGEWQLAPGLVAALLGKTSPITWEDEVAARKLLGMDLVGLTAGVSEKEASSFKRWREDTDFFIFALVDGPFQRAAKKMGFMDFLCRVANREEQIMELAQDEARQGTEEALRAVEAGAHGVILADDIAYTRGLYISPILVRDLFLPLWERQVAKLKEYQVPVFFHSDGNIQDLLPYLVKAGFTGVHSLEPASGMDISKIKHEYGNELCLMGNFDLDFLIRASEKEIEKAVRELMTIAAPGGGFIFSTSSGCLGPELPAEKVLTLYRAAGRWGEY
ncbi:uroporphyrinogen decarboxylase [Thermanaeromonas toyohensis ToBE]|uniref:Uroporphyrinogen decarboxylase n=1 Tax=Thermanaeromonas toyohensis ToBE TaxID=698762 RepID=A0A1W1W2S2_9FIRM|nr:uroporphyrinogen decarboxylase family protein [Thermanaeromonas toyohensis]SMB99908.1 uroporphyrinogen decarboxylase [Thermanaeromonas toyohensis ToBE]